ncbi:hypothetical protein HMPREF9148_02685, partial [Prevotella sp. F0091]
KDTHFEAIHNVYDVSNATVKVVRANAKIHILKQFTTFIVLQVAWVGLYVLMQRYTF